MKNVVMSNLESNILVAGMLFYLAATEWVSILSGSPIFPALCLMLVYILLMRLAKVGRIIFYIYIGISLFGYPIALSGMMPLSHQQKIAVIVLIWCSIGLFIIVLRLWMKHVYGKEKTKQKTKRN
jgi:hypothetical protein